LFCAALSGCAVDFSPDSQSMESAVQTVLTKQGYYRGPVDGTIGPGTSRAIRAYQRDHRLTPTGTINSALAVSMGLAVPTQTNLGFAPYYTRYPGYYSSYSGYYSPYAYPAYYAPPATIGLGWSSYGRGWGGGYYGRGYCGSYGRGWGDHHGHGGHYGRGGSR
jgi:peptidoglycan hydrolase-like protein with peptidoglycan-binding domain